MCRNVAAAFAATAAAVTLCVAPAAVSAQTAPVQLTRAPAVTAASLMARGTPASAAARLARSPYALPARGVGGERPAADLAGNLNTALTVSSTDLWALGSTGAGASPLAEHYNGTAWQNVPMPKPKGSTSVNLLGLTAISDSNVWAVGDYKDASGDYATLSEHWNGTKWSVVATPDQAGFPNNYLYAVGGASADNIWAVGTSLSSNNMVNTTLVAHWNGAKWSEVTSPNPNATYDEFQGVLATSATGLLAIGSTENASNDVVPFAETYDGTAWTQVATPLPSGDSDGAFAGLTKLSPTSDLVYGWAQNASDTIVPFTETWNGTKFTDVGIPVPPGSAGTLMSEASATSASDVWLVGGDITAAGDGDGVIEHWNGTAWSAVSSPNPAGATDSQLTGVAAATASNAWAVGETNASGSFTVLREHWNGKAWSLNES